MTLNCFFGLELHPDGIPVTPVIPPRSKLVLTHCAITSPIRIHSTPTSNGSSSSSHPSHDPSSSSLHGHQGSNNGKASREGMKKSSNGLDSVEEGEGEFLDGAVTLYVQGEGIPETFALGTLSVLKGITYLPLDLLFTKDIRLSLQKSSNGATGSAVGYPSVHLTGYYEEDGDAFDEDSESEEEEDH